jgi:hypothetical protein
MGPNDPPALCTARRGVYIHTPSAGAGCKRAVHISNRKYENRPRHTTDTVRLPPYGGGRVRVAGSNERKVVWAWID